MTLLEKARLILAIGGLIFLVAGIATESRLIVWGAIVLLGASFILRLYLGKKRTRSDDSGESQDLG